jgi:selenocysteine lyase/cysteine desulfurase
MPGIEGARAEEKDDGGGRGGGEGGTIARPPKRAEGYQGFGSFFVEESVEVLVRRDASEYHPPALPFVDGEDPFDAFFRDGDAGAASANTESPPPLLTALACRHRLFSINFNAYAFVNHGAFGAVSRPAAAVADAWRRECERQPLKFFDRTLLPHIAAAARTAASFIGAQPGDVALVPNVTTGLQAAINACHDLLREYQERRTGGEEDSAAVLCLGVGYGAVKLALREAARRAGAAYVEAPLSFPEDVGSVDALVHAVRREMRREVDDDEEGGGRSPRPRRRLRFLVAVVDAVTSNTALALPIKELCAMLRSEGVERIIVDGAHALGQLRGFGGENGARSNLNPNPIPDWGCDYAALNVHKWLCGARGGALLWVRPDHQPQVRPPITSHGAASGFFSAFAWDGARDYAPVLAIPAAMRLWDEHLGGDAAIDRCEALLWREAAPMLARAWGGSEGSGGGGGGFALVPAGSPLAAPMMALVALPGALQRYRQEGAEEEDDKHRRRYRGLATSAHAKNAQDALFALGVECPVKCVQGVLYVRVSCAVYNVLGDYERLAKAGVEVAEAAEAAERAAEG